jgi:hypothetical protein
MMATLNAIVSEVVVFIRGDDMVFNGVVVIMAILKEVKN